MIELVDLNCILCFACCVLISKKLINELHISEGIIILMPCNLFNVMKITA